MIKAIIFDIGGVYLKGNFTDFVNRAYKVLHIDKPFKSSQEMIFDPDLNKGKISHEACFTKYFNVPISEEQMTQIKELRMTTWTPIEGMTTLVRNLHDTYILAVLSNSDALNSEKYKQKGRYDDFDYLVLSHEVGITKPDQRIYEMILDKLHLPAHECLFIDDQEEALLPAKKLGMDTIHFTSLSQLKAELRARYIIY